MTGRNIRYKIGSVLVLLALVLGVTEAVARLSDRYNEQNPVIIACDWELPPYEYLDDDGQPTGYTVELLSTILDKLNVAYTYRMKGNAQNLDTLLKKKSTLCIMASSIPVQQKCYLSSNVLIYYKIMVASQAEVPPLNSLNDIAPEKVLALRLDGRIASPIITQLKPNVHVEYHAPMEALSGVSSGKYDYFAWGEEPLKWKIKELNLENLRLNDTGIPAAEVRLGGFDKELITAFDDQYARMEQGGDLDLLRDKWFHPERHHDNTSPIALYVAIAAVLLLVVLALIHQLVLRRVKLITRKSSEQSRLMNMALDMGGYRVAEYNARSDSFKNLRGVLMDERMNLQGAYESLHTDDRQAFQRKVEELARNEEGSSELLLRRKVGDAGNHSWQYLSGNCIKERDEEHHTSYILVAKDITKEVDALHKNDEMAVMYMKAFDVSLVAMSFYDKDGWLQDMNERMKNIIGVNDENLQYFHETRLYDAPLFKDILQPGSKNVVHACQHMYYPDINVDKYVEYRVRPVIDENDEVRYYAITVRDITSERNLYREQQLTERQLKVTNEEVNKFEAQLRYLLSNSNMFIFHSHYKTRTIELARSLRKPELVMTFDDYLEETAPEERNVAHATFSDPLMMGKPINFVRHFAISPLTKKEAWFAISGTPLFDRNGYALGHFGVIRDVSQLMHSREELRRETERAQQSGQLKATFLANMTHEIRTPLNAIVGFSDLLHMTDSPDDRREFIHIIRHNCDLLLRLIDDILETSDMNVRPQDIRLEDTDFAVFFKEVCHTVAQRVQSLDVTFIDENPYPTFPARTDMERIQQVVTNFVTNAVKYTRQGYIKVGYRQEWREKDGERKEGIYIFCEDTGIGIPKEKQSSVFDRFVKLNDYVQGTGLGLAICKSIADRCGGSIGVMSEGEGKGSTFWLWIPRYLTSSNLTL